MSIDTLPGDALTEIFAHVPAAILCKVLVLVCKRWHDLVESEPFWIEKGLRDRRLNLLIIKAFQEKIKSSNFRAKHYYFNSILNRNLLKNPNGDKGFMYWSSMPDLSDNDGYDDYNEPNNEEITKNIFKLIRKFQLGEDDDIEKLCAWSIQNSNLIQNKKDQSLNFVSLYNLAEKYQLIELNDDIIAKLKPRIEIKESYTKSEHFGCKYFLKVFLADSQYKIRDKYSFEDTMPQIDQVMWRTVKYTFNVNTPVRYIIFYHAACDNHFYTDKKPSCKIANGSIRILE